MRELKEIEELNEKEVERSKFFKRMEKTRSKEEEKYMESLPPKVIFIFLCYFIFRVFLTATHLLQ